MRPSSFVVKPHITLYNPTMRSFDYGSCWALWLADASLAQPRRANAVRRQPRAASKVGSSWSLSPSSSFFGRIPSVSVHCIPYNFIVVIKIIRQNPRPCQGDKTRASGNTRFKSSERKSSKGPPLELMVKWFHTGSPCGFGVPCLPRLFRNSKKCEHDSGLRPL